MKRNAKIILILILIILIITVLIITCIKVYQNVKYFKFTAIILDIRANERNISRLVGIKKANRERLKEYFNIKIDNSIGKDEVIVNDRIYSRLDILRKEINEPDSN